MVKHNTITDSSVVCVPSFSVNMLFPQIRFSRSRISIQQ